MAGFKPFSVESSGTTSENWIDIGSKRIQWGVVESINDAGQVILFDKSFAVPPCVMVTTERNSNAGYASINSVTTTGFTVDRADAIDNADNPFIHWQAIGNKP